MQGVISVGQIVVIDKHVQHSCTASEDARFLVADLDDIPEAEMRANGRLSTISSAFSSFCRFAEVQLASRPDIELERSMTTIFKRFLSLQHSKVPGTPYLTLAESKKIVTSTHAPPTKSAHPAR